MASDAILGRDKELAAVAGFLDSAPGPAALVLEGDAGIGKTTLWRAAVDSAAKRGRLVLACTASESETQLSFTVLGDLLEPVTYRILAELDPPLRAAVNAALLREKRVGMPPDPRTLGLGTRAVIRALAAQEPLAIAIDDVQWVDSPSARVLSFAVRRLDPSPVFVIAAQRRAASLRDPLGLDRAFPSALSSIEVGPLAMNEIGAIIRQRTGTNVSKPVLARLYKQAGGNPLYAIEIVRALMRVGASVPAAEPFPVPESLNGLLGQRLDALSASARDVLLLAASSARATVAVLRAASGSIAGLDEAERAGMIEPDGDRLVFSHPLLTSTVYLLATSVERRAAHERLAAVVTDVEERALHLALATEGPDATVASELDEAATLARHRGAPSAAADLCELAARRTPPTDSQGLRDRLERAAGNHFDAGNSAQARVLYERLLETANPGRDRSHLRFLQALLAWNDVARAGELLRGALDDAGEDAKERALCHASLVWVDICTGTVEEAVTHGRTAIELAESVPGPFPLRVALAHAGVAEFLAGRDPRQLFERALELEGPLMHIETSPLTPAGLVSMWAGDLEEAQGLLEAADRAHIEQGFESERFEALTYLAELGCRTGHWDVAERIAIEADASVRDAGLDRLRDQTLFPLALVSALRGRVEEARAFAIEGADVARGNRNAVEEINHASVLGFLELSLGDPAAAIEALGPLPERLDAMGVAEPLVFPFVPDLVEALVEAGELGPAKLLTDRLEDQGRERGRALALATAARCRGLIAARLGDPPGALGHLTEAIRLNEAVPQPFELGRSLLIAGATLRRMKKKRPARETLQRAFGVFNQLGARLWVDRARAELERIGGRAPSPRALTPTEEQVARLVAEGRSNREVADALFLSVHTVEANLTRIYRKLGIRSRTQLAGKLPPQT